MDAWASGLSCFVDQASALAQTKLLLCDTSDCFGSPLPWLAGPKACTGTVGSAQPQPMLATLYSSPPVLLLQDKGLASL